LSDIPWANVFLPSKILVVCVNNNGDVVAVCGIRSVFNIITLYVCEKWRGKGVGTKTFKRTITIAKKRHISFILFGVYYNNIPILRLTSKFGCKDIMSLKKSNIGFKIIPLNFLGHIAYISLRVITSLLPNVFWTYVAQRVHDRTISGYRGG
jgi:GNAT superfamily N-acetyltransferase